MKYIMAEVQLDEVTVSLPFIFPQTLTHKDVAKAVAYAVSLSYPRRPHKIVSAGFVMLDAIGATGKSESLNIKSRNEDLGIINSCDYGGNIK